MPQITYQDVWRRVRLYVPGADVFLVRTWVLDAYRQLTQRRGFAWSIGQTQLAWDDARTPIPVTTDWGAREVTSAALFVPEDAGRQLRVTTYPIYTIVEVVDESNIVLDRPFYGPTPGPADATISDCYTTLPADFSRFIVVVDPTNQRLVPFWGTQEELALVDPTRSSSDAVPRLLVAAQPSPYAATLGQLQYEYWPKPTAQGALQAYYIKQPTALADDYVFTGALATRSDVLEKGALAAAAKWPGTAEQKNPYFNLGLATQLQRDFEALCVQLEIRDDDAVPQDFSTIPWQRWNGFTWAYDCRLLQQTDATLSDYVGYLGGAGW